MQRTFMYARIIKFVLGPNRLWEAERMADVIASFAQTQRGYLGFQLLSNVDTGEFQTISFWASKSDWLDSLEVIAPYFSHMIGDDFQWKPSVEMFEVYDPKIANLGLPGA